MKKTLLLIPSLALLFSCHKNSNQSACGTQICDATFRQIDVVFTDKTGQKIFVSNFSAVNQRTNMQLQTKFLVPTPVALSYNYLIADDSMRDQLSTDGDPVIVKATNSTTGQTKTVTFNIVGGCNCHVQKIGETVSLAPDTIRFDQ